MKFALFVLSVLSFLAGLVILMAAKTSIGEIEGFMFFIVSAVLFSGAAIVEAINLLNATPPVSSDIKKRRQELGYDK